MVHRIEATVTFMALVFSLVVPVMAQQGQTVTRQTSIAEPAPLAFDEFFESSTHGLKPTNKLIQLNSKRVRLTGFMAQMEIDMEGSFFLVPRPIFCDEEGSGNADIPPEAVLVNVPFRAHERIPFVKGLLEVTGVLEVGNKEENGRVSSIRLILDGPSERSQPPHSKKTATIEQTLRNQVLLTGGKNGFRFR